MEVASEGSHRVHTVVSISTAADLGTVLQRLELVPAVSLRIILYYFPWTSSKKYDLGLRDITRPCLPQDNLAGIHHFTDSHCTLRLVRAMQLR